MEKLTHGQRVRIVNSMLYTNRTGTLIPTSGLPDDPWDFYVELDPIKGSMARTIGVHKTQVVAL